MNCNYCYEWALLSEGRLKITEPIFCDFGKSKTVSTQQPANWDEQTETESSDINQVSIGHTITGANQLQRTGRSSADVNMTYLTFMKN